MNTSNTFLCYFQTNEQGKPVNKQYVSIIANLDYSGTPIDPDTGDDLDREENLYRYNSSTNQYEKID